ncbi:MAG TPA: hypothetical protein VGR62_21565 [Candidatus Binatia bacterium]|jgi:hypothetical protein|nr:hypothetical protein [Candidatus Binatia bacterium]
MRTRTGLVLALGLLAAAPTWAVTGSCTISKLDVVGDFSFPNIGAVGATLGTDVNGGTFALDRTPFDAQFPSPGVEYFTVAVNSYLTLGTGVATGTIDSTGNVVVPGLAMTFGTAFGVEDGDPPFQFPLVPTVMTGLQAPILSGRALLLEGSPIDPTTGSMRLVGGDYLNFQGVHLTGPGITCTISPIPDPTTLATGPSLKSVKGKAVIGPDAAANDDELTLTAQLKHGAIAPVLDGSADVILRLRGEDGKRITAMLVRKGKFALKGKKATATDADGTTIEVITPPDATDDAVAISSGTLTLKRGKKASTLVWKVQGAGLDGFTGTVNVAIAVGSQTASRDITVVAGKKGPKFK